MYQVRDLRWMRGPAVAFFLLMCLSAVYLQHHYVTDVLLGIAYAMVTLAILVRVRHRLRAARASSAQPRASGSPRPAAAVASSSARE